MTPIQSKPKKRFSEWAVLMCNCRVFLGLFERNCSSVSHGISCLWLSAPLGLHQLRRILSRHNVSPALTQVLVSEEQMILQLWPIRWAWNHPNSLSSALTRAHAVDVSLVAMTPSKAPWFGFQTLIFAGGFDILLQFLDCDKFPQPRLWNQHQQMLVVCLRMSGTLN